MDLDSKVKVEPKNEDRLSDYCGLVKFRHYGKKFKRKVFCDPGKWRPYEERMTTLGSFCSSRLPRLAHSLPVLCAPAPILEPGNVRDLDAHNTPHALADHSLSLHTTFPTF